jgi:hypothetical protein
LDEVVLPEVDLKDFLQILELVSLQDLTLFVEIYIYKSVTDVYKENIV